MIKVKVYGTYITGMAKEGDYVDFSVEGVIGDVPQDSWILSMVRSRYLESWIKADNRYKNKRLRKIDKVFIEHIERTGKNDLIGKNILELDWEELQHLGCMYPVELNSVPLRNTGALREAQEKASELYLERVKGVKLQEISDIYTFNPVDGTSSLNWKGKKIPVESIKPVKDVTSKYTLDEVVNKSSGIEIIE